MLTLIAALTLAATSATAAPAATPAVTPPLLSPPQAAALRCGVVFARAARMQAERDPAAAGWPVLAVRGREYFVRVLARLVDDTGASRETLAGMAAREAAALTGAAVQAAMPPCLALLEASGI